MTSTLCTKYSCGCISNGSISFSGPLASALCNKYSCRFVVMLGALISSLGVLLSAFVPSMPYLYFTYGVMGGKYTAGSYVARKSTKDKQTQLYFNLCNCIPPTNTFEDVTIN